MAGLGDDQLGRRLAEGNEQAFTLLYDRYGPRLYRTACALLDSRHDAEDAVQAVFLGLVAHRHALAKVENWWAYLLVSLRHEAARLGSQRRRRPNPRPVETLDQLAASVNEDTAEEADRLEQSLARLPTEQRQVIRLKTESELTFAQIAEVLGISPNTAASRYRYALEKLRHELREHGDEPTGNG
jgi:RNA polymerase sigma-70 factor, ECF subfamily